jgi:hypothetical protein
MLDIQQYSSLAGIKEEVQFQFTSFRILASDLPVIHSVVSLCSNQRRRFGPCIRATIPYINRDDVHRTTQNRRLERKAVPLRM